MNREMVVSCLLGLILLLTLSSIGSSTGQPNSYGIASTNTVTNYATSTNNPFEVHNSTGRNNTWTVSFAKGTYYLDLGVANPFKEYFNLSITGDQLSQQFYTNNFEFHGLNINNAGNYVIKTTGKGSWIFSLFAQNANQIYNFSIAKPTSFVIVPNIYGYTHIKLNLSDSVPVSLNVYNELLSSIYSGNLQPSSIINLNLSGDYDGILFLSIYSNSSNAELNINWTEITTTPITSTGSTSLLDNYLPEVGGISIVCVAVGAILYRKKVSRNNKRRRR